MVNFYARRCEKNGLNFNDIPSTWKSKVEEKIKADGYVITKDGTVIKADEIEEE